MKSCLAKMIDQSVPEETVTIESAMMQISFGLGCPGANFAAYEGKSIGSLRDNKSVEHFCDKGPTRSYLSNSDFKFEYSVTKSIQNQSFVVKSNIRTISADSTAANTACTSSLSSNTWSIEAGCTKISRDITTSVTTIGSAAPQTKISENYAKLVANGLTESDDEAVKWFPGGKFDVTFNDWNGAVTYSDGATPPTFTVTRGSDTATGSLATTSTLPNALQASLDKQVQSFQALLTR